MFIWDLQFVLGITVRSSISFSTVRTYLLGDLLDYLQPKARQMMIKGPGISRQLYLGSRESRQLSERARFVKKPSRWEKDALTDVLIPGKHRFDGVKIYFVHDIHIALPATSYMIQSKLIPLAAWEWADWSANRKNEMNNLSHLCPTWSDILGHQLFLAVHGQYQSLLVHNRQP